MQSNTANPTAPNLNDSKQANTTSDNKRTRTDDPEHRVIKKTFLHHFTPLIEVITPGQSFRKRDSYVKNYFVPDFYYINRMSAKSFDMMANERDIKKHSELDPYGFALYINYVLMYLVIRQNNDLGTTNADSRFIQTAMENAGITEAVLPMYLHTWVDGLGSYTDEVFNRLFQPILPPIEVDIDDDKDLGYWSKNTAHLLPNFFAIMKKVCLFGQDERISILNKDRSITNYRNVLFQHTVLSDIDHLRVYDARIPGPCALETPHVSTTLTRLVINTLKTKYSNPYGKYLRFNPELISYLCTHYGALVRTMDYFSVSTISPVGNDFITCILVEEAEQDILQKEVRVPVPRSLPPVATSSTSKPSRSKQASKPRDTEPDVEEEEISERVILGPIFTHNAIVYTKSKKVNGTPLLASITPLVRLAAEHNRVPFEGYDYESPYHPWFEKEYEFESSRFSLEEHLARFIKLSSTI